MKISLKHCLKICSTIVILFLILPGLFTIAQDGKTVISKIQDKFGTIKTIKADFTQEFINSEGQSSGKMSGTYLQATGDKFKISTERGEIISDGNTVWNVNKNLERVVISNADDRTNSFSLEKVIFDFPALCEVKLLNETSSSFVLELVPNENLGFSKATLTVSNLYLINSVLIEDFNNVMISFKLNNYEIDRDIDPGTFIFTPYEGIEIIDLR